MPGLSEIQKLKFKTILIITIMWMLFYTLVFLYEFSSYKIKFPEQYPSLNPWVEYRYMMIYISVVGIIGGTFFAFNVSFKPRKRPFYYGILFSVVWLLLVYILIILISIIWISLHQEKFVLSSVLGDIFKNLITSYHLRDTLVWIFIVVITQLMLQVNEKFGPGNLWKIIIGKYYSPKEELRVFMFLDIKSSTSIAENLGHQKYYHFLNEFFATISDSIINRAGEIYQYVGDEIVVSWTAQKAINNMNCLYCFFDIKTIIDKNKNVFIEKFGLVPEFKAGIHFGPVTAGEVGVIKRDIVFTGDVLNTTSRIRSSCNSYQVDLLVSENTLALFDNLRPIEAVLIDHIELRGKENKVNVYNLKLGHFAL